MKQIGEVIEGRPLFHIDPTETVRKAARTMSDKNVGCIAVIDDDGRLVGMFSERDVLTRIVAEGRNPDDTLVANVMTKEIIAAEPTETVNDALTKMRERNFRHLPVVQAGHLIGMISIRDLLQVDGDSSRARASFLNELVTYSPDYES